MFPAHLGIDFADNVASLGNGGIKTERIGHLRTSFVGETAHKINSSFKTGGGSENVMTNLLADVLHQVHEHIARFGFVFHQRIFLAVRPQVYRLTQAIHCI